MKRLPFLVGAIAWSVAGCSPQRFFFYPNRTLYADPDRMGLKSEIVQFSSANGKTLFGLFIPTPRSPKGTIVHFHGNYGNLSNHFPMALFLLNNGYDVLAFDYQGYGASEGTPSPERLVEDGRAAIVYAQEHLRNPKTGVAVFSQSLGGAAAIVSVAKMPSVKGLVVEAAFSGYRAMGKAAMKRSAWLLPLYPVAPLFLAKSVDPASYIKAISPRPILLIHGDADEVVPVEMARVLFDAARDPKELWIVPGAKHLGCRTIAPDEYESRITRFFDTAIEAAVPSP